MAVETIPVEVLAAFCVEPVLATANDLGSGNINDTFLVTTPTGQFVLQRINERVFVEPLRVIENFQRITEHLRQKRAAGETGLRVAEPVFTHDGRLFCRDGTGGHWRAQSYLPHAGPSVPAGPAQARRVGRTLATFHRLVADLELGDLADPLPGFHNLAGYLADYDLVGDLRTVSAGECRFCQAAVERYRPQAGRLETAVADGILVRQPVHGDPKLDNFLFDRQGQVAGLLDLDTVAVGLVQLDLGDCLRSCCNPAGELGDGGRPLFDLELCRAVLDGYFATAGSRLSAPQRAYIFDGLLLICYELGLRFFTDHLRGNRYFKVDRDGDNLRRAEIQFRLTETIAGQEERIRRLIAEAGCAD